MINFNPVFFHNGFKVTIRDSLEGQVLTMKRESQDGSRVFQGSSEVCADSPLQSHCCPWAKSEARTITTDEKEPLRQQITSKMATEAAKVVYSQSKTIVEPVFGQTSKRYHFWSILNLASRIIKFLQPQSGTAPSRI